MIKLGTSDMAKAYVGSTEVSKVYLGSELVWENSDPYVEYLKTLGCICYLPLGASGDLKDRISGKSLTTTGQGSLAWDSSINMYKVTTSSTNYKYVAWLDNGMNGNSFPNDCYTTLTTFRKISTSGYCLGSQISPITTDNSTMNALNTNWNGSVNINPVPSGEVKLALYCGTDERNYYQEGALYNTYSAYSEYYPSNWVVTSNGLAFGLSRNATNYKNKQYGIKDIYLFNTKLTLEQIRNIQGFND